MNKIKSDKPMDKYIFGQIYIKDVTQKHSYKNKGYKHNLLVKY